MSEDQKAALEALVETNEQLDGPRIVIDYAITLACEVASPGHIDLNRQMTDFVETLYRDKWPERK